MLYIVFVVVVDSKAGQQHGEGPVTKALHLPDNHKGNN